MSDLGPVVVRRTVNAPQETVWAMLSDATARSAWWPETDIELELGGAVIDARGQHGTVDVLVEGLTLGFRWADEGAENARTVVVMLRPEDEDFDQTRVTVIESGFATLADATSRVQAETSHWEQTLEALSLNAEDPEAAAVAVTALGDLDDDADEADAAEDVAEELSADAEFELEDAEAELAGDLEAGTVEAVDAVDADEALEADGDAIIDEEPVAAVEADEEASESDDADEAGDSDEADEAEDADEGDDDTVEVQLDETDLNETAVLDQIDDDVQETTVIELVDEDANPTTVIDALDDTDDGEAPVSELPETDAAESGDSAPNEAAEDEAEHTEGGEVEQSFESVLTGDQSIIEIVQDDVVEGETFDPADAILLPEVGAPFTETGGIQITADLGVEEPVDVDETSEWERLLRGE
ncbi:SRPBCC domain-containing protein [Leucobacter sp. UCMA 4100]|uniref:SRPBCC domain-containing protein n=1 Tax=Leucobacter sp. UCMA 4100 TaxID=2810534 RepID=UPI0022EB6512|nr:SRPBCC domain-containing protein [Leucobacter sp. UCMA 4100]MDA3146395.1 SRPBCC domain-containing protein [Leucobacter sp. UCMA 4100]